MTAPKKNKKSTDKSVDVTPADGEAMESSEVVTLGDLLFEKCLEVAGPRKKKDNTSNKSYSPPPWALLGDISAIEVATIAATFNDASPTEAIIRSYNIIDQALRAQKWVSRGGDLASCLEAYRRETELLSKQAEAKKRLPPNIAPDLSWLRKGIDVRIDFDEVLLNLMPNDRTEGRQKKFSQWIAANTESILLNIGIKPKAKIDYVKAATVLHEALKKNGVPGVLYRYARRNFQNWWEREKSMIRSAAGKVGGRGKTKGKQGRVKKKNDKRLGAKPPKGGDIKKVIEGA